MYTHTHTPTLYTHIHTFTHNMNAYNMGTHTHTWLYQCDSSCVLVGGGALHRLKMASKASLSLNLSVPVSRNGRDILCWSPSVMILTHRVKIRSVASVCGVCVCVCVCVWCVCGVCVCGVCVCVCVVCVCVWCVCGVCVCVCVCVVCVCVLMCIMYEASNDAAHLTHDTTLIYHCIELEGSMLVTNNIAWGPPAHLISSVAFLFRYWSL